jgi:hypothetical protein
MGAVVALENLLNYTAAERAIRPDAGSPHPIAGTLFSAIALHTFHPKQGKFDTIIWHSNP